MIEILWILAAYALAFCAAVGWVWRDMRRLERRLQSVLDDAKAAARAQTKEARAWPSALEGRVEALEQAMDMAEGKRKQEFDITEGLTSLLRYDPYAAMRKDGGLNGE